MLALVGYLLIIVLVGYVLYRVYLLSPSTASLATAVNYLQGLSL